jgi:hypothetical protein
MISRTLSVALVSGLSLILTSSASGQPPLNRVMREKLQHTQKILEAVVTSNWVQLEQQTRELDRLTDDPRWTVLKYPEYAKHSLAFKHAVQELHTAAEKRDLDDAVKAYHALTGRCVECHRYMARSRIAH